jgi:hypothetical protein
MNMPSFIFGGSGQTDTPTYESLKRKREIADMLAQQSLGSTPQNMGEGIASIGQALMSRMMDSKIGPAEDTERQSMVAELARIQGGLGPEGISPEALTDLSGIVDNPYSSSGVEAVARSLMRRQVTQPEQPTGTPFVPPQFGGNVTMSSQNMPDAGQFGWTDPGEIDPLAAAEEAKRLFDAQPTDDNAARLDAAVTGAVDGYGGTDPKIDQQLREMMGWVDGSLGPQSGAGGAVQRGPTTGPQVAEADTGNKTDARDPVKLTEGQSKDVGFWNRMDGVSTDLDQFEGVLTDAGQRAKGSIPMIGNALVSEDYQRARRAAEEWVTGILRKDTGAAVTAEEASRYDQIYIPQAWDDAKTVEDKRAARKRAEQGLKKGLGIAEVLADELAATRPSAPASINDADADLFKKYGLEP